MKKRERLELIKTIVLENAIETQNDLVKLLENEGLKATQATISRDINEIGIVKVPASDGRYIYGLSKEKATQEQDSFRRAENAVKSVSENTAGLEHLLHIDVIPGNSYLIKRFLLERFGQLIFSLIADDDSLLLILKDPKDSEQIRQEIKSLLAD
ncbi:arginine repressor [Streptococcus macacae]|uniref:Arginine repressor n=1 Tax=Streptococcus macacae NCTC 11558 TaxID=764298 RepID=G5JVW9_9STRE|nr:ArgR family transcriptional regulator [Streptococcus macacae]EHJ52825.1 arginine repressor, C-terminal domain protein [Streptococcus macacae NCTC 11558]SUN78960.1 arginine repressor [Streptococcus macacae NCTC 11558]